MQRSLRLAVPALALALLSACAVQPYQQQPPQNAPVYGGSQSVAYGQVRSIEAIGMPQNQPLGAGAVVGGIVGAIVGRQFADGRRGENVGTAVGAVGGALIGHEIEKNARREQNTVRVNVALDQGGTRSIDLKNAGDLRIGDRVRIDGNNQIVKIY